MKHKRLSIPITYFIACLAINAAFYLLLPRLNIIPLPIRIAGIFIIIAGSFVIAFSLYCLVKNRTAYDFLPSSTLVTGGIYAFSRNPMYIGFILFLLGLALASGNVVSLASPIIFFLIVDSMFIPYEEEKMEKAFGHDYLEYKSMVKRWL